jgi:NAD(P)-dependent dehydrogenase (short-subunit alcohol dehydrogenase family)
MRAQGWGRIVNVASANGLRGAAGFGPYNASKEAIRALTRTAAREWARHGIVVNCFCPASAAHRMPPADDAAPDDPRRAAYAAMYADHPMGRDGDPEADIAPVVLFLLSDACRYLTGETLKVDGGGTMWA